MAHGGFAKKRPNGEIVRAFGVGIIFLATRLFILNANIRIVYSIYIILDFLSQIPSRFDILKILARWSTRWSRSCSSSADFVEAVVISKIWDFFRKIRSWWLCLTSRRSNLPRYAQDLPWIKGFEDDSFIRKDITGIRVVLFLIYFSWVLGVWYILCNGCFEVSIPQSVSLRVICRELFIVHYSLLYSETIL